MGPQDVELVRRLISDAASGGWQGAAVLVVALVVWLEVRVLPIVRSAFRVRALVRALADRAGVTEEDVARAARAEEELRKT